MAGAQPSRRLNPASRSACEIEIEPGRRVPNHWDEHGPHLFESYESRKAQRALAAADRREFIRAARDAALETARAAALSRRLDATVESPSGFGGRA